MKKDGRRKHTLTHFKQPTTDALTDSEQIFSSIIEPRRPQHGCWNDKTGELRLQPASCSGAIGSWQGLFRAQCSANEEERCAVIDVGFSQ